MMPLHNLTSPILSRACFLFFISGGRKKRQLAKIHRRCSAENKKYWLETGDDVKCLRENERQASGQGSHRVFRYPV